MLTLPRKAWLRQRKKKKLNMSHEFPAKNGLSGNKEEVQLNYET